MPVPPLSPAWGSATRLAIGSFEKKEETNMKDTLHDTEGQVNEADGFLENLAAAKKAAPGAERAASMAKAKASWDEMKAENVGLKSDNERLGENLKTLQHALDETLAILEELKYENERLKANAVQLDEDLVTTRMALDQSEALLDDARNALVGQEPKELIRRKELDVFKAFCDNNSFHNFVDVRHLIHNFNTTINSISRSFLNDIVFKDPEVFQEELDKAHVRCRSIIGDTLCSLLIQESTKAEGGGEADGLTPSPVLVQATLQVLLLNLCVPELLPHSYCAIRVGSLATGKSDYLRVMFSRESHPIMPPRHASLLANFMTSLRAHVTAVMRTAGWAMRGKKRRSDFEEEMSKLFDIKESLRTSLSRASGSTGLEVSVVGETDFIHEFMEVAGDGAQLADAEDRVVGTLGLGLKKVVKTNGPEGWVQNVLRAEVILESTLRNSISAGFRDSNDSGTV